MNRWKLLGFTVIFLSMLAASGSPIDRVQGKTPDEARPPGSQAGPVEFQRRAPKNLNVDYIGHIGGAKLAVAVQGDYAYVGEGGSLTVLDISHPTTPIVVGRTDIFPQIVQGVAVSGGYAYVVVGEFWLAGGGRLRSNPSQRSWLLRHAGVCQECGSG